MKKLWLVIHSLLLTLAAVSWLAGADDLFGICVTTIIVLSFPLNLLVGWLFFAFERVNEVPGIMLVMAFVMSAVGYVQWFEVVPRIAGFFSRKLSAHDLQMELSVKRSNPSQIEKGNTQDARDWAEGIYDEEKYTPVERVLTQETD